MHIIIAVIVYTHSIVKWSVLSLLISTSPHCGEYHGGSERDRGKME